jgi:hypothetical protein
VAAISVGIVVPVEIAGCAFVYIGDLDGRRLIVERREWERQRPTRGRMKCFYWDGVAGLEGRVAPAPDLLPDRGERS